MSIEETYKLFVKNRSVYCSSETLKSYDGHMKVFFTYLSTVKDVALDALSFDDLQDVDLYSDFIIYLRSVRKVKNSTVRSYCRTLKAYLKFCYQNDLCKDYLKGVKLPPDDSLPKVVLYADEVVKLDALFDRETVQGIRDYIIVHLMLDCGLRSQEVRHLTYENIDHDRNILHILDSKGNKSRITLIPDFLISCIDDYMRMCERSSGTVILTLRGNRPLTKESIKDFFQHLKEKSGIKRIHAHLLRHTFATSYLIGGGNLEFLRVFMGHSDYNVTKTYSQLAAECKMLGVDVYHLDKIFFTRGY